MKSTWYYLWTNALSTLLPCIYLIIILSHVLSPPEAIFASFALWVCFTAILGKIDYNYDRLKKLIDDIKNNTYDTRRS